MGVASESSQRKVPRLSRRIHEENTKMKNLVLLSMVTLASCAPQSLVVTTTTISTTVTSTPATTTTTTTTTTQSPTSTTTEKLMATEPLEMTKFHIKSEIQFRYARTVVESTVTNPDTVAQLASFALVIPDSAFMSAFSMEIGGEEYNARVEEKEEAEKTFEKALNRGRGAGLVSQDAKDANKFTVSTNIEGGQEVVFRLTYDELLGRKEGMYRQEINIDPQQIVEDFRVEVFINESLPITEVSVPELLESNSIDPSEESENSFVTIEKDFEGNAKNAKIVFAPTAIEQRAAAEEGMSGRLRINYDVDRQNQDSEVQVIDGYFVHYFVPENLETLPKHAIFILDVSGSMYGERLQQLKDAMFTVLDDMKPEDFFNIITFSTSVTNWSPSGITTEGDHFDCIRPIPNVKKSKAQEFLQSLHAFLNIQQLLKKDKKAEALALALENHFVTPVTSLVVVRPDEEDTLANVDDPTPDYNDYGVQLHALSYAAPAYAAAYQPQLFKSVSPHVYSSKSRIVGGSAPYPTSAISYNLAYDDGSGSGYESYDYVAYDAYDNDYAAISSTTARNIFARATTTTTSTTSTTSQPETCQLTLYSKTYNRGDELVLLDDSADLGSFSDVAISALVEGSCCWQLFGEVNFAGPTAWLRPGGIYKGTDSFGRELFQEVSSLRRVEC